MEMCNNGETTLPGPPITDRVHGKLNGLRQNWPDPHSETRVHTEAEKRLVKTSDKEEYHYVALQHDYTYFLQAD